MIGFLYDLIYIFPITALSISASAGLLSLPESRASYYIAALLILACCFSLKHIHGRLRFLLPGVSVMLFVGILFMQEKGTRGSFLYDNIWGLWTLIIVSASFIAGGIISKRDVLKLISGAGICVAMVYMMIRGPVPDKLEAALAFLMLAVIVTDEVQRNWKKNGGEDRKGHLVSVTPFVILLALAVYLIPAPDKAYDWHFVKVIMQRISDGIKYGNRLLNSDKEEYAGTMGFNDKGTYFGNLQVDDDGIMRLETSREAGRAVYLSGRILDSFDGRSWDCFYVDENTDKTIDSIETLSAILNYDRAHAVDYYKRVKLTVTYEEFNTGYYFVPQKTLSIDLNNEKEGITSHGGELKSIKRLGFLTSYDLTFIRINNTNPSFWALYENAVPVDEKSWMNTQAAFKNTEPVNVSFDQYKEYVKRKYEYYLPETIISDRAAEYIEKLSEGAEDDIEILRRIEKVLSSMHYTLSPGELPDKVDSPADFLDRLLFETQDGYCTHYATAFVLMARSLGYPARFVQGFLVPLNGRQPYHVMSSMAHAWPEVYIDNIGWVAFEPTPGIKYDLSWPFMKRADDMEEGIGSADPHADEEEENIDLPELEDEEKTDINWRAVILTLLPVAAFLLVFMFADRIIRRKRLEKMGLKEKALVYCRYGLKLLAVLGLKPDQGETLEEFGVRAKKLIFETDDEEETDTDDNAADGTDGTDISECLGFISHYESILYSEKTVTDEDLNDILENIKELFTVIGWYKGRLRTLFIKLRYVI